MVPKRKHQPYPALSKKRRKVVSRPVEEIVFDTTAREEFLTGFHKRKRARARHAQEMAAKKERAQKNEARRRIREDRKRDVERHTEAVNRAMASLLRKQEGNAAWGDSESEGEGWQGLQEPEKVDHEDEYSEEDRHTVVTVEEMDASRQGLRRVADHIDTGGESIEESDQEDQEEQEGQKNPAPAGQDPALDEEPATKLAPKKKKTNFRYENKAERKFKKYKERAGKRPKSKSKTPRKT